MISTATLAAVVAFSNNFDPAKTQSNGDPFSFLTSAVRFGFLNAINSSKKHFDGKNALMSAIMDGLTAIDTGTHHSSHVEALSVVRTKTDQYTKDQVKDYELDGISKHKQKVKAELKAAEAKATQTHETARTPNVKSLDNL
jgi:hypothetical protein